MNNTGYSSITIGDEVVELYYGTPANAFFYEYLRNDPDNDIMKPTGDITPVGMAHIIYCGYKNHCQINNKKPKYHLGVFIKHIDDCQFDEEKATDFANALQDYINSKFTLNGNVKFDVADQDLKKK